MDHNTTVADVAHKANDFEAYAESSYVYIWPVDKRERFCNSKNASCAIQLRLIGLLPKTDNSINAVG